MPRLLRPATSATTAAVLAAHIDPLLFRLERPRYPRRPSDDEVQEYLRDVYRMPESDEGRFDLWLQITDRDRQVEDDGQ